MNVYKRVFHSLALKIMCLIHISFGALSLPNSHVFKNSIGQVANA